MIDISKVIHAPVGGGRYTVTAPIVKEDYGLYLKIEGLELPSTYEVDFSNSEHNGTSVTMIGNSDGVLIPNQFISSGKDVFAFLYHVGDNYGRTVFKFRIPNKLRPDRTDEEPTPEEQSVIDQAINALNEAVEQTTQDVIDADASAQASAESAQASGESALSASNSALSSGEYASNALGYAESASASATASAQSASQSAQIKSDVEGMVDDAQASANASAQSATASANSASQASASATSASQSATSAQGYASQAQTSAQTASSKATEASGYASTASAKATESAQSASQALTYKTDAESAKTSAQTAQGLAESARDLAQGYAEDAQGYAEDAQASAEGISASASQIAQNTANILKAFPTDTASGAVAGFSDGADGIPLKSLIVNIDPVQDTSSGDPSPENICPISGRTGMNVTATNTNLRGGIDLANDIKARITSAVINTEEKTVSWGYNATHNAVFAPKVPFKENTRYTFIVTAQNASKRLNFRIYYSDDSVQALPDLTTTEKETLAIVTFANKTVRTIVRQAQGGTTKLYYDESGIFEGVLTASDFQPFGRVIPINWQTEAGTVYGGRLDVLSGVLRVDRVAKVFDGTQTINVVNWRPLTNSVGWLFPLNETPNIKLAGNYEIPNLIADKLKTVCYAGNSGVYGLDDNCISCVVSGGVHGIAMRVKDTSLTTQTAVNTWLANNPVTVVYEITDPIEIQLDAHTVNSIYGTNNIFADTGDSAVEYRADTTLYIGRLTEPDADMIADSNITSGKYFMVGNNLYLATANIASGGQVIVGTNCIRKSLSEALNEINA